MKRTGVAPRLDAGTGRDGGRRPGEPGCHSVTHGAEGCRAVGATMTEVLAELFSFGCWRFQEAFAITVVADPKPDDLEPL